MAKNGYIAAVLDQDFSKKLKTEALHPRVYGHQVTLAFNPSDEVFKKYEHLIGRKVEVRVHKLVVDSRGQAALVTGLPTENGQAHVTLSCAEGVRPAYSNELVRNPDRLEKPFKAVGSATVRFVQHQGTR